MSEWTTRAERLSDAQAEFLHIMTSPAGEPTSAYADAGVVGYVFGEMWRRGVLSPRDRRWITLCCVGAVDTAIPIQSHVWAALNSGDITFEEFDEFVLHFATQLGWPKGSALAGQGAMAMARLASERGEEVPELDFERWIEPGSDDARRARGEASYWAVHGVDPPPAESPFRGRAYLDYLYGEIWTRDRYLARRDRRIITICCSAAVGVDSETTEHLRAALVSGELTRRELQELVVHYAVYVGWVLGRHLDDLLANVSAEPEFGISNGDGGLK